MLYIFAVVLILLWLLGLVSSYTLGGFIHVLLIIALVVVLVNVIGGKRVCDTTRAETGTCFGPARPQAGT
jgi:hypothetical protein